MRVGVISNLFPPFSIGGYEQLCGKVCDELTRLGHQVAVLTSTYGGTAPNPNGQIVDRRLKLLANEDNIYGAFNASADERDAINRHNKSELLRFRELHRPDIWFVWNLYFFGASFVDEISSVGEPAALFLTDNWLIAAEQPDAIQSFFSRHVHAGEPFHRGRTQVTGAEVRNQYALFGSKFMLDLYESFGFRFKQQSVVHNGVHLPMVPPEFFVPRFETREPGRLKLLFAGRVVDIKGPQIIIPALPLIRERAGCSVSLTIVGDRQDTAFAARLMDDIERAGCGDMVSFRDPVSEALLPTLFNDHDIYIFPSLYEPFSLTLIHAIGAGIPTVATDVGGNAEIVSDSKTGLLFDRQSAESLADAVLKLAGDVKLRTRLSLEGRRVAKRFTFRRMIRGIERELLKAAA